MPKDTESIIKESKTVGSESNMILELGFNLKGKKGVYTIETDDEQIVYECLSYKLKVNKRVLFKCNQSQKFINSALFKTKESEETINKAYDAFWGKHSLLSIILNELNDKSKQFIEEQLSDNILEVIDFFMAIACRIIGEENKNIASLPQETRFNPINGISNINRKKKLLRFEKQLSLFFSHYCKCLEGVKYHFTEKDNKKIEYQLYSLKKLSNKIQEIDFEFESSGIRNLTKMLPFILTACKKNGVAMIDEPDNGLHETLIKDLIYDLQHTIEGQLILTTHCVSILDEPHRLIDPKNNAYAIITNKGDISIKPLNECGSRIFPNTNIRTQYLKGSFWGIPIIEDSFDFKSLLEILKNNQ
jgi:hypothetical protein